MLHAVVVVVGAEGGGAVLGPGPPPPVAVGPRAGPAVTDSEEAENCGQVGCSMCVLVAGSFRP